MCVAPRNSVYVSCMLVCLSVCLGPSGCESLLQPRCQEACPRPWQVCSVCSQQLASLAGWDVGSGQRLMGWALSGVNYRASDTMRPQTAELEPRLPGPPPPAAPVGLPTIYLLG